MSIQPTAKWEIVKLKLHMVERKRYEPYECLQVHDDQRDGKLSIALRDDRRLTMEELPQSS